MAGQAGGMNAQQLFAMGQQQAASAPAPAAAPASNEWKCENCGTMNTGKFCSTCGSPMPAPAVTWTCTCGTTNTGKFCSNCGQPNPNAEWRCECGTVNTGKFCSNCGKAKA